MTRSPAVRDGMGKTTFLKTTDMSLGQLDTVAVHLNPTRTPPSPSQRTLQEVVRAREIVIVLGTDRTSACIRLPTRPLPTRSRTPSKTPALHAAAPAAAAPATAHTRKNTPKTRAAPPSLREAFPTVSGSHADSSRLAPSGPSSFAGAHRDHAARAVFAARNSSRAHSSRTQTTSSPTVRPRRGGYTSPHRILPSCVSRRDTRGNTRGAGRPARRRRRRSPRRTCGVAVGRGPSLVAPTRGEVGVGGVARVARAVARSIPGRSRTGTRRVFRT